MFLKAFTIGFALTVGVELAMGLCMAIGSIFKGDSKK